MSDILISAAVIVATIVAVLFMIGLVMLGYRVLLGLIRPPCRPPPQDRPSNE